MTTHPSAVADWKSRFTPALSGLLCVALALIALYTAGIGLIEEFYHRGAVTLLAGLVILLEQPLARRFRAAPRAVRVLLVLFDLALAIGLSLAIYWFFHLSEEIWSGIFSLDDLDIALGLIGMVVLIELTRRSMGLPLALLAALSIIYCLFGDSMPWILRHAGYTMGTTVRTFWYSLDAVFGLASAVMVGLIYVYIVFGAILEGVGGGSVLLKLSSAATARLRGGPAHAAVLSSAMFGTLSGSAVANVVGTGVFTIPMIRQRGFSALFAGAVEAAASTGGQFLPPVMGAAAFMMAELTGVPYLTICAAALIPAMFYFGALFCAVGVEAKRRGLEPIPKAERPVIGGADWVRSLLFFVPIAVVIWFLVDGWSPAAAGFYSIISAIVMGLLLNPDLRRDPMRLVRALIDGGRAGAPIMIAVATIGILIGMVNMTGLGLRLSNVIVAMGEGSLFLSLFMTMLATLALGMGLPTLPAYLITVVVMGPALQQLGVSLMLSHLFVIYYAGLSAITPPVAVAAYAAGAVAKAGPMRTAAIAVRLALVGFIIPFVFVYETSLVLVEGFEMGAFLWIAARLGLAIWLLTTGLAGHDRANLPHWSRGLRLALAVCALVPDPAFAIPGVIGGALMIVGEAMLLRQRLRPTA